MNTDKVAEIAAYFNQEDAAAWISNLWDSYDGQRAPKKKEWKEIEEYLFATDARQTANKNLPWTHTTVVSKLTNIRDNLHSNYLSSLFPNDKWLQWLAYDRDSAKKDKAQTIQAYMENKTREGGFRNTISDLLYDYIDKGSAFCMPSFEHRYKTNPSGEKVPSFIGPKAVRISPYDIVFNPTAAAFENTFKVVRSTKSIGELEKLTLTSPEHGFWSDALDRRRVMQDLTGRCTKGDFEKASMYEISGFGSLYEYYKSDYVEILEFYGDFHDGETLHTNRMITVVDRSIVVRDEPMITYGGEAPIRCVGWRSRPDNLWASGPLDNLVGMQYMINHIVNQKANALDLMVMPPLIIKGDVEEFEWKPKGEIHIDADGDVKELGQNLQVIFTANAEIEFYEERMELYAGAPREAMGVRTPGEKTAFEVQALENAAGRIFQEKVIQFEVFMEKVLNDMLETSHRNMDVGDVIRVIDNDLGTQTFMEITKEDIVANGILRPVGARHFAQKAQELQNLVGVFNSPIANMIAPHTSGIELTRFIEDVSDLRGYSIFRPNVAVTEAQETESLANQAAEDNEMAAGISEEEIQLQQGANEDAEQVTE